MAERYFYAIAQYPQTHLPLDAMGKRVSVVQFRTLKEALEFLRLHMGSSTPVRVDTGMLRLDRFPGTTTAQWCLQERGHTTVADVEASLERWIQSASTSGHNVPAFELIPRPPPPMRRAATDEPEALVARLDHLSLH